MTDAKTPIAMYEIKGIATEGADKEDLIAFEQKVFNILSLFPQENHEDSPWLVSVYAKDEDSYTQAYKDVEDNVPQELKKTKLTTSYLKMLKEHFEYMSRPEGMFTDTSGEKFRFKNKENTTSILSSTS